VLLNRGTKIAPQTHFPLLFLFHHLSAQKEYVTSLDWNASVTFSVEPTKQHQEASSGQKGCQLDSFPAAP